MSTKEAAFGDLLKTLDINSGKLLAGTTLVLGGMAINKAYNQIKNDATRRTIISDLHLNDPVLSKVPDEQLLEWYATIYHFAPKFSLDKNAVREVLQGFARFGRVDVNTLKMLAETEKAVVQADKETKTWGSLFGDLAKTIAIAN